MSDQDLKKAGLKVTLPRLKILSIFESAKGQHLSAEDVYKTLKESGDDVGLATVYRVLTQFEAAGLLKKHQFDGEFSVYELDQGEHHDHLVCVRCSKVQEFVDEEIEARQDAIAKKMHFKITDHSLNIFGICKVCQELGVGK